MTRPCTVDGFEEELDAADDLIQRLRDERDDLLDLIGDIVSEIKKYHGDFDAHLFVKAEKAIKVEDDVDGR